MYVCMYVCVYIYIPPPDSITSDFIWRLKILESRPQISEYHLVLASKATQLFSSTTELTHM